MSGGDDLNNIVIKQEDQFHAGLDGDQDMKGYSVPGFNDSDGGIRDHADSLYDRYSLCKIYNISLRFWSCTWTIL